MGLSFGLSSIVGARPDGKYTHLFVYAVVGYIAFVLPRNDLDSSMDACSFVEAIQRAALVYCIGLLLTGVLMQRCEKCT